MNKRILWITQTAVFIALLVTFQLTTQGFGQYVTGSLVNMTLAISVMLCGLWTGLAVAMLSPIFASFVGIAPTFPVIIPFIMLGNAALVVVWHLVGNRKIIRPGAPYIIALVLGAVAKFLVLFLGVVHVALPFIINATEQQAARISTMFSLPQLVTALVGGAVAAVILPVLKMAVKSKY